MEHCICYKCFIPSTRGTRNADTAKFFPQQITFPKITTEQYLKQAVTDILAILQSPDQQNPPYIQLAQILNRATSAPEPIYSSPVHLNSPSSVHVPLLRVPSPDPT